MHKFSKALPVDEALPGVANALAGAGRAVLVAPPGAGKTTRVPLALLDAPWLSGKKIIVLEPRRIAARGAAEFMSREIGDKLGGIVGLRARLASKVSAATRIEVITEGVFTRMILDDPELQGAGAVLFDEFHERSLDADLGLALALDARSALRPDLRLLVMSATLDGARVSRLLGDCPVVTSEGRTFPIETRYLGRKGHRIEDDVTDAVMRALREETGSVLAFLPGQGEISRTAERLRERITDKAIDLAPLYGALDMAEQDRAISPAPPGRRKVVLATSIAETSITIEGVRVVIDCGLARVPRYEPDAGVSRLETVRVSRAAADQRRGRAGRTEPGICYRLWDEPETQGLLPFAEPEIKSADLSGLLLDCAEWGTADPRTLLWLDPPSEGLLKPARDELVSLGALDAAGRITDEGRRVRSLPLPPRLARMVLSAARHGAAHRAALIAAVLVERGIGGNDPDLVHRLELFARDRSRRAEDLRRLAAGWARSAEAGRARAPGDGISPAALLALAYPDRIAKSRGTPGQFLLANGRAGSVDTTSPLARAPFLVVAEMQGKAAATRILLAAETGEAEVLDMAGAGIETRDEVTFDAASQSVRARTVRKLGAITLENKPRAIAKSDDVAAVLAEGIARIGVASLPWSKAQLQLRARVAFLAKTGGDWPDLSDEGLTKDGCAWLAPFLAGKSRIADISAEDLAVALERYDPVGRAPETRH